MEAPIAYTEIVRHIKQHENKTRLRLFQAAIDEDRTGIIYLYAKGGEKMEIKRYKNGRFIKKVWC